MQTLVVIDHPVVQTKLTELRDINADHREFRALLDEIAGLMVYEVTRDWPTKPQPVRTPLEETIGKVLARQVTLVRAVVALGALAAVIAALHISNTNLNRAYYGTYTRPSQLLAGALLPLTPRFIVHGQRVRKL